MAQDHATGGGSPERMALLDPNALSAAQARALAGIMDGPRKTLEAGSPSAALNGPFNAWLRSPALAERLQQLGAYIRFETSLEPRLNEFAILISAVYWRSQYEWFAHHPLALKAGLDPRVAAELGSGTRPNGMRDDEAIVYEFSTQLRETRAVDDIVYAAALASFGERGIIDLVAVAGYYDVVSMTLNVARALPPADAPVPFAQAGC